MREELVIFGRNCDAASVGKFNKVILMLMFRALALSQSDWGRRGEVGRGSLLP